MKRLVLTALLFCAPSFAQTVAMIPYDNLSGSQDAPADIAALMSRELKAKGWNVAESAKAEDAIERERVRYLDSLSDDVRHKILTATDANALLSLTIYTYQAGRNPIVAISARLVREDGTIAWSNIAGTSAAEEQHMFGFGAASSVQTVADSAVRALMRHFPRPKEPGVIVHGQTKPLMRRAPASVRASGFDPNGEHRICVLPFDNLSSSPEAARVVSDLLLLRLAAAKNIEVVEPAAMRAAALEGQIGTFRDIDSDQLARLAPLVGTPLFLRGTIYSYVDPAARTGGEPEFSVELSLVDVETRQVLWVGQHSRKGQDYVGFLMLGRVTNVVSLADRVLSELIDAGWRSGKRTLPVPKTAGRRPTAPAAAGGERP